MRKATRFSLGFAIAAVAMVTQTFAADPPAAPKPFARDTLHQIEVTIEAIDAKTRTVSLRGPMGLTKVVAGPEVRNFANMKVGDKVRVSYYEGLAAEIRKKGSPAKASESLEITSKVGAPVGSTPAGAEGRATLSTVKIQSVDTKANSVTFKQQDGSVRTVVVTLPDAQAFIKTLKAGDEVDLAYTEAVAVEVIPTQATPAK
jgi:Cu/Ag efflux protein CusF